MKLWQNPHARDLRVLNAAFDGIPIYSGVYVAYRSWDSSTTALVVGLTTPHDELTDAFKAILPGEYGAITPFIMLRAYFSTVLDCAKETGDRWIESDRLFVSKVDPLCHPIAVTNEIGRSRVKTRLQQRRRATQESRDAKPICNLRQEWRIISSICPRRVKVSLSNDEQIGVVAQTVWPEHEYGFFV